MSSDLTHLTGLVTRYVTAHAALVAHPDFEAGCPPDRLYHARDDAAVEVAEAVTHLLDAQMHEHFLDANERMGAALVEIGMALGLPRPGGNATWGVPEILAKIAEGAVGDPAGGDAPASWVARITGPCWIVDGDDVWEQPHYPGSFAAAQAAQRAADEDGNDPRPIRQLDQECWAAARDGYLVEDDDLGLVHHCTEDEARAATGPAGDDTAPPTGPASGSVDGEGLHPFHRS